MARYLQCVASEAWRELTYPWRTIYEAFPGWVVSHGKAGGVQQEPGEEDGPRCGWAQPQRGAREPVGRAPMLGYGGVAFALVWFGLLKRGHLGLRHFVQKAGEGVLCTFSFSVF